MGPVKPDGAKLVEDFYGVYLLYCLNPKYRGRTYIGYTVDPNRRIFQHNKGKHAGGAWRTSNRGPWEMVLIVHGFPNDISALRFEWAWQHPQASRRLRFIDKKKSNEKTYDFCLRVLGNMLNVGPWNRLPLTVRWLKPDFCREFPAGLAPPLHMPIAYGPVASININQIKKKQKKKELQSQDGSGEGSSSQQETEEEDRLCNVCFQPVASQEAIICLNKRCLAVSHILCLSGVFLAQDITKMIPVEGECPTCSSTLQWGELVRGRRGCHQQVETGAFDEPEDLDS